VRTSVEYYSTFLISLEFITYNLTMMFPNMPAGDLPSAENEYVKLVLWAARIMHFLSIKEIINVRKLVNLSKRPGWVLGNIIVWWEKVEWLQEPRLQGKESRQDRVRAITK
jgi:hypothetical protein